MDGGSPAVLLHSRSDAIATLTLNRPHARNALSRDLLDAVTDALAEIAADRSVRVVVIAGSGPGFCPGHDLREMRADPREAAYRDTFDACSRMMIAIVRLPQPVIAQVHGIATAAGCQLAAACDLVVAADTAHFAVSGIDVGLFCSTPMVALSRAVSRKHALEMLVTGEMISAQRAFQIGLVNRVVPEAELAAATGELAAVIAAKSPLAIALGKQAFYRQAEMTLDDAYAYTAEVMTRNMLARDAGEGIDAFLQKRKPVWTGT